MNPDRLLEINALVRPGKGLRTLNPRPREMVALLEACRDLLAALSAAEQQAAKLQEALAWFDFIEDVEDFGPDDRIVTVTVGRSAAGWRKAKLAYAATRPNPERTP